MWFHLKKLHQFLLQITCLVFVFLLHKNCYSLITIRMHAGLWLSLDEIQISLTEEWNEKNSKVADEKTIITKNNKNNDWKLHMGSNNEVTRNSFFIASTESCFSLSKQFFFFYFLRSYFQHKIRNAHVKSTEMWESMQIFEYSANFCNFQIGHRGA